MAEKVIVREVGLRDGLQMIGSILLVDRKVEWCRREVEAGVSEIEVTSFVPPRIVPQFADAEAVVARTLEIPGLHATALVPNLRGAQRAFGAGLTSVEFVLSASDAHNQRNVRRSTAESVADFGRIMEVRKAGGYGGVRVAAGIATAFGCAISGAVEEARVLDILSTLLEYGADDIVIADTVGYANPRQVGRLMREVMKVAERRPVTCHFHDTRGLGLANVCAALDAGVRRFDASLGGLGGCPFAPNATGNINTEDCVFLLESMGLDTGISVDGLLELRAAVESWLPDEPFVGAIARAGLPKGFHPANRMDGGAI